MFKYANKKHYGLWGTDRKYKEKNIWRSRKRNQDTVAFLNIAVKSSVSLIKTYHRENVKCLSFILNISSTLLDLKSLKSFKIYLSK